MWKFCNTILRIFKNVSLCTYLSIYVSMYASKFVITCNSVLRHNPGFVTHKPKIIPTTEYKSHSYVLFTKPDENY